MRRRSLARPRVPKAPSEASRARGAKPSPTGTTIGGAGVGACSNVDQPELDGQDTSSETSMVSFNNSEISLTNGSKRSNRASKTSLSDPRVTKPEATEAEVLNPENHNSSPNGTQQEGASSPRTVTSGSVTITTPPKPPMLRRGSISSDREPDRDSHCELSREEKKGTERKKE